MWTAGTPNTNREIADMANNDYNAVGSVLNGSKEPTGSCALCEAPIYGDGKTMKITNDLGVEVVLTCRECYEFHRDLSE